MFFLGSGRFRVVCIRFEVGEVNVVGAVSSIRFEKDDNSDSHLTD